MSAFNFGITYREWCPKEVVAPKGTFILSAEPDEAFLDLDTVEQLWTFIDNFPMIEQWWPVKRIRIWRSRSKGVHVVLKFETPPTNIRLIQTVLGSDPIREVLNLLDQEKLNKPVNVLFKPASPTTIRALVAAENAFICEDVSF